MIPLSLIAGVRFVTPQDLPLLVRREFIAKLLRPLLPVYALRAKPRDHKVPDRLPPQSHEKFADILVGVQQNLF